MDANKTFNLVRGSSLTDPRAENPDDSDQNATQQVMDNSMSSASFPYTSPNLLSLRDPLTNAALISNLRMIGQERQHAYPSLSTIVNNSNLVHHYYNRSRIYYPQWQINPNLTGVDLGQSLPQYSFSFPPHMPRMNLIMGQWPPTSQFSNQLNDEGFLSRNSRQGMISLVNSVVNPPGHQNLHHERLRNPILPALSTMSTTFSEAPVSPSTESNAAFSNNNAPGSSNSIINTMENLASSRGNTDSEQSHSLLSFIDDSRFVRNEAPTKNKKKKRKKRRRKEKDAPKRPMSAYNLFFKDIRAEILKSDVPNTTENIDAASIGVTKSRCRRRKGRSSPHNKISFQGLGVKVGEMWRNISDEQKQSYQARADEERKRYRDELLVFQTKKSSSGTHVNHCLSADQL